MPRSGIGKFVDHLHAKEAGKVSKAQIRRELVRVLEGITELLVEGNDVALMGFGTFTLRRRKARAARNPNDGKPVRVPPKTVVVFKPSRWMKFMLRDTK